MRSSIIVSSVLIFAHYSTAYTTMSSTLAKKTTTRKVALLGSTGKLGREAVIQLSSAGIPVRCLLRHEIRMDDQNLKPSIEQGSSSIQVASYLASLPNVEMVKGDVTDRESLEELLTGCTDCLALHGGARRSKISDLLPWSKPETQAGHPKLVNYDGINNLIHVMKLPGSTCKRIVRITGKGEGPWGVFSILINLLGGMAKAWNYEGEELLRQSDVNYTIIRPGVMGRPCPEGAVLALADNGGDLSVSPVAYPTIASLCVQCLDYNNARRSTLCAMNVSPGEGEETYAPLLARVNPDTRTFPASLMKEHLTAVRTGAVILFAILSAGTVGIATAIRGIARLIF